jgi:hypothetical protein
MSEHDDPLVEALRRKQQGQEAANARYEEERRASKEARAEHVAAFKELVQIPRGRLAAAAQAAGMKLTVDDHGDSVYLRLGDSTFLQFRVHDLGNPVLSLPQGDVAGVAYFGEASTLKERAGLNSCNFIRVRTEANAAPQWKGCWLRISGAVPGEKVAARLRLQASPTIDDTFGVDDAGLFAEHVGKAARMMHVVTLDVVDDVSVCVEQIIAKGVA